MLRCKGILIFMEPCQSGLTYLFAKEAGASKPLAGSNPAGSAIYILLYPNKFLV